jgi:hypothetical protein
MEIRSTGRFINNIEKEDASLLIVLELFQGIAFLGRRTSNLKVCYTPEFKSFGDFLHQIVELNKQKHSFFRWNFGPTY